MDCRGPQRQKDRNGVVSEERRATVYDSGKFTLANGVSLYDLRANEADVFDNLELYTDFQIWADQDIIVKYNDVANKDRYIECGLIVQSDVLEVTDIYITNSSGETATVNFYGTHKGV